MPISIKTVLPFILFALFLSGCNDRPQQGPIRSIPPSQPLLTPEELAQYSEAVVEPHRQFSLLLINSTPDDGRMRDGDPLKKAETFLAEIDEIDLSKCPEDYKKAFNDLKGEWAKFYKLIVKNKGDLKFPPGPRPMGLRPISGLELEYSASYKHLINLLPDPEYQEALDGIKTATEAFEPVAKRYNRRGFSAFL